MAKQQVQPAVEESDIPAVEEVAESPAVVDVSPEESASPTADSLAQPAPEITIDTLVSRPDLARRIRVNRAYAGFRTSEQAILPGLYYEDDPSLFSLAEWLVKEQYGDWA